MDTTDDGDVDSAHRYPREPDGPSLDCPTCDVHGRTRAEYATAGARGEHDLNEFVAVYCKSCGTKLGTYKLMSTEDIPPWETGEDADD